MHPSEQGPQAYIVRRNGTREDPLSAPPLFVAGSYDDVWTWTREKRCNGHSQLIDFDGPGTYVGIHIDTPFTRPGETR